MTDLMQALASVANFRWAVQGKIQVDAYCRSQCNPSFSNIFDQSIKLKFSLLAALEQIGNTGAAICVIVISLLVLARNVWPTLVTTNPRVKSTVLVVGVCIILLMVILIPALSIDHYYGNTG